jgi:hypothetical protein
MADAQKSDAMKKAEEKGMAAPPTTPHGTVRTTSAFQGSEQAQRAGQQTARQTTGNRPFSLAQAYSEGRGQGQPSGAPGSAVDARSNNDAARVMGLRSTDVPGGVGFHGGTLYELQTIYSSLRDGAHYQAFRQAIAFLNDLVNASTGPTGGGNVVAPGAMRPPRAASPMPFDEAGQKQLDDVCNRLQQYAQFSQQSPERIPQSGERFNPAQINVSQVGMLVQLILQLVGQWRSSQGG